MEIILTRITNDVLRGGVGNDTYIFNIGDGLDVIDDADGADTVRFGAGITLNYLSFVPLSNNDLVINFVGTPDDQITISGQFTPSNVKAIENIILDDLSTFTLLDGSEKMAVQDDLVTAPDTAITFDFLSNDSGFLMAQVFFSI